MAASIVIALQGETLDALCFRVYGNTSGVEQVLEANPGLCEHGPLLPMGTPVRLPNIQSQPTRAVVNIWD